MANITIYRPPATANVVISIDEKTVFSKKLMNEHKITSEIYSIAVLDILIGDYITFGGENYYINRLPQITRINDNTLKYIIEFESVLYDLYKKLYVSSDGLSDFAYTGQATDFLSSIVNCMNTVSTGWGVGTVDATTEKTIQFVNESCRSALTRVAQEFELEFSLSGKTIQMIASVGVDSGYSFEYGKGNGLYRLERQQVSDQNIVTRLFGFGGTKNLPSTYRTHLTRLVFEDRYLENNVATYGVIEGQFTDENIYPKRTGTITAVNMVFDSGVYNPRSSYIEDSALAFDINSYKIEGLTATIVFKSGDLSGQEFEIWKYNNTTKRIYFNPYSDTTGYVTPNSLNLAAVGDTYTLVNISLPQSYIDDAEDELEAATLAYLTANSVPHVVYSLDIDPKYTRDNAISLDVGDQITLVDADLTINSLIRITSIEFPIVNRYKMKLVIANFVPYTSQERTVKKIIETAKTAVVNGKTAVNLARFNENRRNYQNKFVTIPMYQGLYSAATIYYGNPDRRDIVKYDPGTGEVFYISKFNAPAESFSAIVPTNTSYWERFQAEYSSIATELLFAELAYIENLGVRYFQGVPTLLGGMTQAIGIENSQIWENNYNGDGSAVYVNRIGYNGGVTRFRNFIIYDGKGNQKFLINGAANLMTVDADVQMNHQLRVVGHPIILAILTQTEIDNLTPSAGMIVYNSSNGHFYGYTNAWRQLD